MRKDTKRVRERMVWLLRRIAATDAGTITAWDAKTIDNFIANFPESDRIRAKNSDELVGSQTLTRAANLCRQAGYIVPGTAGNMACFADRVKTWNRTWTITDKGREFLRSLGHAVPDRLDSDDKRRQVAPFQPGGNEVGTGGLGAQPKPRVSVWWSH